MAFKSLDRSCGPKMNGLNGVRDVSSPLQSDSTQTSLLPCPETPVNSPSTSNDGSPVSNLQISLIGQFKGFSITPMNPTSPTRYAGESLQGTAAVLSASKPPASSPVQPALRKAPAPPSVPVTSVLATSRPIVVKASGINKIRSNSAVVSAVSSANNLSVAPAILSSNSQNSGRPLISSPVLDATTSSTARDLVDGPGTNTSPGTSAQGNLNAAPVRPAPVVPAQEAKPLRPVSLHNEDNVAAFARGHEKAATSKPVNYPTLTKLASMLRPSTSFRTQEKREEPQNVKAGKLLDKDKLRTLQISNPIPQQEIDVPHAVPVQANQPVVMRAQSMRAGAHSKRPAIQSFGSMRQPGKRPASVTSSSLQRPSAPPPPRPPPLPDVPSKDTGIIGLPGYQNPPEVKGNKLHSDYSYDDCLNVIGDAPLAHIDEENSPSSGDNIYAVIEESPENGGRNRVNFSLPPCPLDVPEYISPTASVYKAPINSENIQSAGSSESIGLLSEIVSAIQARNTESIYSSSSIPSQEALQNDEGGNVVAKSRENLNLEHSAGETGSSSETYFDSTSSCGYLSPNVTQSGPKTVGSVVGALKIPSTAAPASITTSTISTISSVGGPTSSNTFKPYGASLRSRGPLASTFALPSASASPTVPHVSQKPQVQAKKPVLKQNIKHSPKDLNSSLTANDSIFNNKLSSTSVSPDVVSSCSSSADTSSPDVISPASAGKSVQIPPYNIKVPEVLMSAADKLMDQGASLNAPTSKPDAPVKTVQSITKGATNTRPPISSTKPLLDNRTQNLQTKASASKTSNVASLQQKFESGPPSKVPPAVKPRVQQAKPNVTPSK